MLIVVIRFRKCTIEGILMVPYRVGWVMRVVMRILTIRTMVMFVECCNIFIFRMRLVVMSKMMI